MNKGPQLKPRTIDQRFKPPVRGINFVEAMNYIHIDDVGPDFIYDNYTSSCLPYASGNERELEAIAAWVTSVYFDPFEKIHALTTFVAQEVLWAGYYEKKNGTRLAIDRNLREKEIFRSGYGWCNEQARVLCYLTQIAGFTSRLVFAANRYGQYGHVITEVLHPSGWLAIDQSFGFCFLMDQHPVRAFDIYNLPQVRSYFQPIYKAMCENLQNVLGKDLLQRDFAMSVANDPLDGFESLGYHNHYAI